MTGHAIWSDFRGVLTPPLAEGIRTFCAGREFGPVQLVECLRMIGRRYGCADGMTVLDTGLLNERQWTREIERGLAATFGISADLADFGAGWWSDRRVDPDWVAAVESWRDRGIFVGLVSNLPVEWKPHFASFADFAELFDAVLLSCDVGARKPEARIFQEAESRSGLEARFNILVDDLTDNVAGARRVGWLGVHAGDGGTRCAVAEIESILRTPDTQHEGVV
jgi:FMN phosphatase YigB (HAD superfamily)